MVRLASFLILWLISIGLGLAAEPGGEIVSPKKVKITASAPKYNKDTGLWDAYVTLKNKTRGKAKQDVYGPFTLVFSVVKRSDVVMTNSSGQTESGQPYLALSVPSDTLISGQKIKKIPLHFFTPTKKKFKVKYQLYGYLTPQTAPQITSISPAQAATGSRLTIKGSGFTPSSHVFFNHTALVNPKIISSEEIQVSIPFATNDLGQLIPLAAGTYPLTVDGSTDHNVTVTDLPQNPHPAGTVMNDLLGTLGQSLTQLRPEVEAAIGELRALNAANPDALAALDQLYSLLDLTTTALQQELPKIISTVDPTSLDTLERALLNNGLDAVMAQLASNRATPGSDTSGLASVLQKNASQLAWQSWDLLKVGLLGKNAYAFTPIQNADEWLETRKSSLVVKSSSLLTLANNVSEVCNAVSFVSLAFPITTVGISTACASLDIITGLANIYVDLVLYDKGSIKSLDIKAAPVNVVQETKENTSWLGGEPVKKLTLFVSNIDNPNAYFQSPSIVVTHNFSALGTIKNLVSFGAGKIEFIRGLEEIFKKSGIELIGELDKNWTKIKDGIWYPLTKLASLSPDLIKAYTDENNTDEGPYPISLDKVEFDNCEVYPSVSGFSRFRSIDLGSDPDKALIKVPNLPELIGTSAQSPLKCDVGIKSDYRTTDEESAKVKADYVISGYYLLNVSKSGSGTGTVLSSPQGVDKPEFGIASGIDCPSSCSQDEGYFPLFISPVSGVYDGVKTVTLTANADSGHVFTGWSGPDAGNCPVPASDAQSGTCSLTMDGKEKNITASFENNIPPPPDIVGTWNAAYYGSKLPVYLGQTETSPGNIVDVYLIEETVTLTDDGWYCWKDVTNTYVNDACENKYIKYRYTYDPSSPFHQFVDLYNPLNESQDVDSIYLDWVTDHWELNYSAFYLAATKI